jgi:hypothetical protein
MIVNGMTVETLDPMNDVAVYYANPEKTYSYLEQYV